MLPHCPCCISVNFPIDVVVAVAAVDADDADRIDVVVMNPSVDATTVTSNALAKDSGCLLLSRMQIGSLWYCLVVM